MLTPVGATESSNLSYQWLYILLPKRWVLDYPPGALCQENATCPTVLVQLLPLLYSHHLAASASNVPESQLLTASHKRLQRPRLASTFWSDSKRHILALVIFLELQGAQQLALAASLISNMLRFAQKAMASRSCLPSPTHHPTTHAHRATSRGEG